jgi:hypothetical protein
MAIDMRGLVAKVAITTNAKKVMIVLVFFNLIVLNFISFRIHPFGKV